MKEYKVVDHNDSRELLFVLWILSRHTNIREGSQRMRDERIEYCKEKGILFCGVTEEEIAEKEERDKRSDLERRIERLEEAVDAIRRMHATTGSAPFMTTTSTC